MITLISQPEDIELSKNPILYKFRATDSNGDPYGPKGVRSELATTGIFDIDENDTLVVDWTEPDGSTGSVTFVFKNDPLNESQLPADAGDFGDDFEAYWQAISDKINNHSVLSPHFKSYIVYTPSTSVELRIETQEIDNDWSVSFDDTNITNPNTTVTDYATTVADNTPSNYKLLMDIMFQSVYSDGPYKKIEIEGYPDEEGYILLNIQDILHAEIKQSLIQPLVPSFNSTSVFISPMIRKFYVRYREDYDAVTPSWNQLKNNKLLCGGVSQHLYPQATDNFLLDLSASDGILSWYPTSKYIDQTQPEYISWFNYTGGDTQVVLRVVLTNVDGNTETIWKFAISPIEILRDEVAVFPTGYTQLNLSAATLENVIKYEVQLFDYDDYLLSTYTAVSEARTYYLDNLYYEEVYYLQYLNSFYQPQTLRCIGVRSEELSIKRTETQAVLDPETYTESDAQIFQYDEEHEDAYTYRSGFITREEEIALQEIFIYNILYQVKAGVATRLYITDKKFKIADKQENLHSVEFNATKSLMPISYSNDNVL